MPVYQVCLVSGANFAIHSYGNILSCCIVEISAFVVVDSRIFSPVTQIKSHSLLIHVSYKTGMLVKGENQTPYGDLFHKNTTS